MAEYGCATDDDVPAILKRATGVFVTHDSHLAACRYCEISSSMPRITK
jgi:hypothetical protein